MHTSVMDFEDAVAFRLHRAHVHPAWAARGVTLVTNELVVPT